MTHVKSIAPGLSTKLIAAVWLMITACEPATPPAAPPPAPPPPPPAAPPPAATPALTATPEPVKPAIPAAIVVKDAGLKTPESVVYDAEADVYLVSNINGKPTEADDNGFISKIDPEGKVTELAFIDGAKKEIKLNAPKGMALVGDVLYVADLDIVRMFDRKTGKAKGEIRVPKATFLNDIAVGQGSKLFVSDSGLKMGKEGLEPNGSDAVFSIDTKAVASKPLRANKDLTSPNGVIADEDGVLVVTFRGAELYRLNKKGEKELVTALPKGSLDGIVRLADGTLMISSWDAQTIYRGRPGGTFEPVLTGLTSPADIGLDTKRNRLLVPSFQGDIVTIQPLPELAPLPVPAAAAVPTEAKPASTDTAKPATPGAKPADTKAATPAAKPADTKAATPAAPAAAPAKPAAPAATPAAPAAAPAKPAAPATPAAPAAAPAKPAAPAAPAAAPAKPAAPAAAPAKPAAPATPPAAPAKPAAPTPAAPKPAASAK